MKHILCLLLASSLLLGCHSDPSVYTEKTLDLQPTTITMPKGYKLIGCSSGIVLMQDPKVSGEYVLWDYVYDGRTIIKESK